ncbi:hypothetical protein ACQP10_38335 (plasmid) [Streptosporangium sandarakinum]|uniref:hypothetical protein n=1 Tax=Streptosporangium sandarakinum TaxID=1260955 RepID=UPI003D929BBD
MTLTTLATPGTHPACVACADPDPSISDDGLTACCGDNPVYCPCPDCGAPVHYLPNGTVPDYCPNC